MTAANLSSELAADSMQPASAGAPADVVCAHCGLPVPAGLVDKSAEHQFCCHGCATVWRVIHACGLDRYYGLREAAAAGAAQAARTTGRPYDEFDDAAFERLYVRELADGTRAVELLLEGVHCGACVWLVEKLPVVAPFVVESRLDFRRATVQLRWDPARGRLSQAARALDSLGYAAHPARGTTARDLRRLEERRLLVRIAVAAAAAGNAMLLAIALYGGAAGGGAAGSAAAHPEIEQYFRWWSMALGLVALAWPGRVFFRGAWAALRTRSAHLDLPIALALATGGVAGITNTVLGRGEIYFDSLTVLVFLLLVGRYVQRRQQRAAAESVELLYTLTPTTARRVEADGPRDVPIEAVAAGDLLEVRPGETMPADGRVESGHSEVDQSVLTGESRPVCIGPGDAVSAGTLNLVAPLRVRAEATGEQTRVGRLMQLVQRAASEPAPVVRVADRIAGYFTAAVIGLALLTAVLWWRVDWPRAIDHAVALLIVTCPCALGLATPLAISVAIGRAARRGILIKGGEALEGLARTGTILFDKTGTLTVGRPRLLAWYGDAAVRPLVKAAERHSAHPIAEALRAGLAAERELVAEDVRETLGGGVEAVVGGRRVQVGSMRFVAQSGAAGDGAADRAETEYGELAARVAQILRDGQTPVAVAVDGELAAVAALGDALRADAADCVARLRRLGWRVRIVSGDHPDAVRSVARRLGLAAEDGRGHVTPEQKLAAVRELRERGPVVMVGDGVNDSAALAAATIGIAVQGGAEASLSSAHVYLRREGLAAVVELIHGGRRTVGTILRGLIASLGYNVAAAAMAVAGLLHPLAAAILMPISSLSVLSIAVAGRTFGDRACR